MSRINYLRRQMPAILTSVSSLLCAFCIPAVILSVISTSQAASNVSYPTRPIRLISPFAPGGGNDFIARTLVLALTSDLGQTVVVDNRPGANTIIGMDLVAKAQADGYTLILTSSTLPINATLYRQLPYDSRRDFAAISLVGTSPLIVATPTTSAITTINQLIAAAKAKPGELAYPSAGTGNSTHLAGELFAVMAHVKLLHVPYKGSGPGITDLIAGRLAVVFSTSGSVIPHIKSGKLRALGVTSAQRSAVMPELVTVAEAGVPGYEASSWYGIVAPSKTPTAIVTRLHQSISHALAIPEVHARLTSQAIDPAASTPSQFATYIQAEIIKWAGVLKAAGVSPQ